jgi:hypothetical protein
VTSSRGHWQTPTIGLYDNAADTFPVKKTDRDVGRRNSVDETLVSVLAEYKIGDGSCGLVFTGTSLLKRKRRKRKI